MSVFAQGSIELSGNPNLMHAPGAKGLILVTNGDLKVDIDNTRPANDYSNTTTGVILVRGQIATSGRFHPHGQIIVQNEAVAGPVDRNTIGGVVWLTKLGQLSMEGVTRTSSATVKYVNDVTGWMEGQ